MIGERLAVEELVKLLDATYHGPERSDMAGFERVMLYTLAVETGLRGGELRSLTRAAFDLDGDNPTVTVDAEYSKRRRQDTLPLRPALAVELRSFLAMLAPTALVFPNMPQREHLAKMFRADLEAAGIAYVDAEGQFADFHSLRHAFITFLARGGVHPKVAQALARHSTITLTMDRYSHTLVEEHSAALTVLPDLSTAGREAVRATGTDDARGGQKNLASRLMFSGGFSRTSMDSAGLASGTGRLEGSAVSSAENAASSRKTAAEGGGFEPPNTFVLPVFKTGAISRSATPPKESSTCFYLLELRYLIKSVRKKYPFQIPLSIGGDHAPAAQTSQKKRPVRRRTGSPGQVVTPTSGTSQPSRLARPEPYSTTTSRVYRRTRRTTSGRG